MNTITLKISFNPLNGKLSEQLKKQKLKFNKDEVEIFNESRDAIFTLSIDSLLTDKQEVGLKKKLFRRIESHIKKMNNLKSVTVVN